MKRDAYVTDRARQKALRDGLDVEREHERERSAHERGRHPIRVDEHGNCELQHHHVDGGRECIRRDDNLVARADAESVE